MNQTMITVEQRKRDYDRARATAGVFLVLMLTSVCALVYGLTADQGNTTMKVGAAVGIIAFGATMCIWAQEATVRRDQYRRAERNPLLSNG